jgi:hypothetical protein
MSCHFAHIVTTPVKPISEALLPPYHPVSQPNRYFLTTESPLNYFLQRAGTNYVSPDHLLQPAGALRKHLISSCTLQQHFSKMLKIVLQPAGTNQLSINPLII